MPSIPDPDRGDNYDPTDPMATRPVQVNLSPEDVRRTGLTSFIIELPGSIPMPGDDRDARPPWQDSSLTMEARLEAVKAAFRPINEKERRRVMAEGGPDPENPVLWWRGVDHPLQQIPWRLLSLLWYRKSIQVEDELLAAIWGKARGDRVPGDQVRGRPNDNELKLACRRVNNVLDLCYGFTGGRLGLRQGCVCWKKS